MAYIAATAVGFPPYYYSQEEVAAFLKKIWSGGKMNLDRMERFHQAMHIRGRHLSLPIEQFENMPGFKASNDAWIQTALRLGENLVCAVLDKAGLAAQAIHQLTFTSITGLAVPSIDARLMNLVPFSPRLKRVPLFGLGCMGGAAGVARVADYLRGHP